MLRRWRITDWMIRILSESNYQWIEQVRCATKFGWPTRRHRYYLVASRDHDLSKSPPAISGEDESIVSWRDFADELQRADVRHVLCSIPSLGSLLTVNDCLPH